MRILLIYPPEITLIPFKALQPYHFVYFGEVAGYLLEKYKKEHKIDIVDAFNVTDLFRILKLFEKEYDQVIIFNAPHNVRYVVKLAEMCKTISPETKIVTYGTCSSYIPRFFLKYPYFDAVVTHGDWEIGIEDFLTNGNRNLITRDDNGKFPVFLDEPNWGFPAYKNLPIEEYEKMSGKLILTLSVSRGCPFGCPFCSATQTFGKEDRRKKVPKIIEFIKETRSRFKFFKFFSPTFTLNSKWVERFCKSIIENKLDIKWSCTTRIDCINKRLLKIMAAAGCEKIAFGVETLNPKILKKIGKPQKHWLVEKVARLCKTVNIKFRALLMVGLPNQTKKDLDLTINKLKEFTDKTEIRFNAYSPYFLLREDMNIDDIEKFDRKSYYMSNCLIDKNQFLKLIAEYW